MADVPVRGGSLEEAIDELAACFHPTEHHQLATLESGTRMVRCALCGAVLYPNQLPAHWTRPELVAHVIGRAGNHDE